MIQTCTGLLNAIQLTQPLKQLPLKITALVSMDTLRNAIGIKPLLSKNTGHSGCLLISRRVCLRKLRKDISYNQKIFLPITRLLQLVELMAKISKGLEANRLPIKSMFSSQASATFLTPALNVFSHKGPVASLPNKCCSPFYSLVTMVIM